MANKEKVSKQVNKKYLEIFPDQAAETLRDQDGKLWLISEQYKDSLKQMDEGQLVLLSLMHKIIETKFKGVELTEQQKKVIMLSYEGLNPSDIARFMKIHVTTVQDHLLLATKKLKKFILNFE